MQKFLITIWNWIGGKRAEEFDGLDDADDPVIANSKEEAKLVVAARLGVMYDPQKLEIEVVPFAR